MSESGGGYGGGSGVGGGGSGGGGYGGGYGVGGGGSGGHPPIVALYAVAIHEARASGDQARMQQVAQAAQQTLDQVDEIRAALGELQATLQGGGS